MSDAIKLSVKLPAKPREVYEAWLNSEKHTAFTGSPAKIERLVDSEFTAWDGYISGKNLGLYRFNRIIQSWRSTDFPEAAEDSRVEILIDPIKEGTKVTIVHTNIPEGDGKKYRKGWKDHYFTPMKAYFSTED
jgi:activator of HSP90 ATPase